jgi:prepilin-type processing-associated H-X9-DG protein
MLNRIFMAAAASLITVGAAYADGHVAARETL